MPAPTPQQQLDQVNAEIARIVAGGQRTKTPQGTEIERASLPELEAMRRRLQAEVSPEQSGQGLIFQPVSLGRVL